MKLIIIFFCSLLAAFAQTLPQLEKGDLILRRGLGVDSDVVALALKSKYTHIGVVSSANPVRIIHATTSDLGRSGVVEFSQDEFLKGSRAMKIVRLKLSDNQREEFVNGLRSHLGEGFEIKPDGLYCSTLIENELAKFMNLRLKREYLNIPFFDGMYLPPHSFLALPHEVIYERD